MLVTQADTPNRTQRRASKTRTRLLKAALSVFAEVGTDAATIEMITQRADLGKGTFYRHFADKNEIVGALIEQCVGGLLEIISQAVGEPHSLREALDGFVNGHVEFFLSRQEEYILLFQGRMLLKVDRGVTCDIERPYEDYLHCVEELVWPFLPQAGGRGEDSTSGLCRDGLCFGIFIVCDDYHETSRRSEKVWNRCGMPFSAV